jgi:glucokinase
VRSPRKSREFDLVLQTRDASLVNARSAAGRGECIAGLTAQLVAGEELRWPAGGADRVSECMSAIENGNQWGLVGDIGATNARFALVRSDGSIGFTQAILCNDFATIGEAIIAFLAEAPEGHPSHAVLAVASSPEGDIVSLTNHPWTFSPEVLRETLGLVRLRIINDFHANALAIPQLAANELVKIGGGEAVAGAPIGILGPGSGLGVSALVPTADGAVPIPSEGGHVTIAAADGREAAVLEIIRHRFGHASAERVLSGPGLVNLYGALCQLAETPAATLTAEEISHPDARNNDRYAHEATEMFCAMLGTVAGNLALTLGARGGIYIAGGIAPKLGPTFVQSAFRQRFEAKGRFQSYLAKIPTYVVTRPFAALLGAASLLLQASTSDPPR